MSGKNFRATDEEVADIDDTTDSDTCSDDDCGTAPSRTADPPPTAASVAQPLAVPMDTTMSTPEALPHSRGPNAQLDLAFCCDCTGSMGAYIRSAQDNILAIAQQIHAAKSQQCSLRFALVKYRDHPAAVGIAPSSPRCIDVMKSNVDTMAAAGATSLSGARAKLNSTSNAYVAVESAGYAWRSTATCSASVTSSHLCRSPRLPTPSRRTARRRCCTAPPAPGTCPWSACSSRNSAPK
jgi:hypothetical protein